MASLVGRSMNHRSAAPGLGTGDPGDHWNRALCLALTLLGGCQEPAPAPEPELPDAARPNLASPPPEPCLDGLIEVGCGGVCPPCADGKRCAVGRDCQSQVCVQQTCRPPSCTDHFANGGETGDDCGGPCPPCAAGKGCGVDRDCASGNCTASGRCSAFPKCIRDGDCASRKCHAGGCAPADCLDDIQNGSETDVDCGGTCFACGNGKGCRADSDCESRGCVGGLCRSTCGDGKKDGTETDVDCGGLCSVCGDGKACARDLDCFSRRCVGGRCGATSCGDGIRNGRETDIDCGGPSCPKCGDGRACAAAADCQGARCLGGFCPSCGNGTQEGSETDVDCGGPACAACPDYYTCREGSDCRSGACLGGGCYPYPRCVNGVQDQDESDVDCGGKTCPRCPPRGRCRVHDDCDYLACVQQRCAAPNQLETCQAGTFRDPVTLFCACDARSCSRGTDCCDRSNLVPVSCASSSRCGRFGSTCQHCDRCWNLGCGKPCSPASCAGCCDVQGNCHSGSLSAACGSGGKDCVPCGKGQACENRRCQ